MRFTASKRITAAAGDVWRVLEDFGGFYRVSPLLECSPVINGVAHGVGAERECQFYDGSMIREKIVAIRAGQSMELAITGSSLPIHDGQVLVSVLQEDQEHARVTFDATITLKFGLLGRLLGATIMQPVLRSQFHLVLRGIATYLATGRPWVDVARCSLSEEIRGSELECALQLRSLGGSVGVRDGCS